MIVHNESVALWETGDCRGTMRAWAASGVKAQACVTSPPYFGLRDYGREGQIGLEETPAAYIAAMVEVFSCVRDVLTDDGTLWLNIGDSYAGMGGRSVQSGKEFEGRARGRQAITRSARQKPVDDIKAKDLIGIPWMLAFALRADGWYLRQDIIWHKPNPMPESVRDRCTKAHEYVFLLTKSERYFFDPLGMQEAATGRDPGNKSHKHADRVAVEVEAGNHRERTKLGLATMGARETRNRRTVWTVASSPYKGAHFAVFPPALIEPCVLAGTRPGDTVLDPFGGSGTAAGVALKHGRNALLCDLNGDYLALAPERIRSIVK